VTPAGSAVPDDPRSLLILSLADDELVMGHRTSHWTGVAPSLEEDLAFATIAQDEINHADVWYQLLLRRGDAGEDRAAVDALGLGRQADQYRHAVLCERPPRDFAYTLARQFCYDHFDAVRLDALTESTDHDIAAAARRLAHEERYHVLHAEQWFARLARAGGEAASRLERALREVWPESLWLFEPVPGEAETTAAGVLPLPSSDLLARWCDRVVPTFEKAGLGEVVTDVAVDGDGWRLPPGFFAGPGGRHGVHTPDWTDDAWEEMTALYRADPSATW
jgi:ring-1,2-phenylacetyl-CoA epoxidase subunit PaaC